MKTILVTGGAGFIGSNFIKYILGKYTDKQVVNVDCLTYAGNLNNLKEVEKNKNYHFHNMDIRNRRDMTKIFSQYTIEYVVNFAAESHVDRSIEDSEVFLTTNIVGTQILLDLAKEHWKMDSKNKHSRIYKKGVKYLQVSTDEVYGSLGKEGLFTEESKIQPNSPYSASKASGDLIVRAYYETYGLPMNITRCSNNYGPYQFPEKLIPLMIYNANNDKKMPVYGDGMQIRDWIHVQDHCSAIDKVLFNGIEGEVYNIGGNNERANIEIVELILETLNKPTTLIEHVEDRLGHDRRYAIDNSKITRELGWLPKYNFDAGMEMTIKWYIDNKEWLDNIISGGYKNYYIDK